MGEDGYLMPAPLPPSIMLLHFGKLKALARLNPNVARELLYIADQQSEKCFLVDSDTSFSLISFSPLPLCLQVRASLVPAVP